MSFTKILATKLFDGFRFVEPNRVLVLKDNLVEAIIDTETACEDIQHVEGIVCPGFVNAHCHLELSYLKNKIPQQTGMVDFLLTVMQNRNEAAEIIQQAIQDAEQEMITNGIVAVGDICNTANTILQKQKNNIHYTNFVEISGFVPATAQKRFEEGKKIQEQFLENNLNATIVPHSPYSVSKELQQLIYNAFPIPNSLLTTNHLPYTIHHNESQAEKEFMQQGTGDFLRLYKNLGIDIRFWEGEKKEQFSIINNQVSAILVHNVVSNEEDIQLLKATNTNLHFCICPNANLYIGNGLPNVEMLLQNDVNICLGTDSLASNTALSILAEIKTVQKYFPKIAVEKLLQWATSKGAKALGVDKVYGSFEKGKSGKFVIIK
jgi:cytosine/adenosine deaminase-related metal-dependent hydrolase